MRLSFEIALLIIALGSASACSAVAAEIRQASFDHRCAPDRITVTRRSDNGRSVEMDVCGSVRRYQNLGRYGTDYGWVDVTSCPAGNAAEPAGVR